MKRPSKPAWLRSQIYNVTARLVTKKERLPVRLFWRRMHESLQNWNSPVSTVIHGEHVVVNSGYTYPIFSRLFGTYNNPLVELVNQAFIAKKRPIYLVDIGAAVGDTVLLINANCPEMVEQFVCIDGDEEFFSYLTENLKKIKNCINIFALLSRETRDERELIRTHGGTASAQGQNYVSAKPLDFVLKDSGVTVVDVLKIDVDGFDGEVLQGASDILMQQKPAVIFEWHPILCKRTGNNFTAHFDALLAAGYSEFVWFDKYGEFSHFGIDNGKATIQQLAAFCLESKCLHDWHFDVVALPPNSGFDVIALADMNFARNRVSRF